MKVSQTIRPYLPGTIFLLMSLVSANAQDTLRRHAELKWETARPFSWSQPSMLSLLSFEGAVNSDSTGLLPVYHERIVLKPGSEADQVILSDALSEPLETADPDDIADLDLAGPEFRVIRQVTTSRGTRSMDIYVLPLRRTSQASYDRLTAFTLLITTRPAPGDPPARIDRPAYASHSVLATGKWYKISVAHDGIYRLTYDDLLSMGMDPGSIDPRNLQLYGNGNGMLPESNASYRIDDLTENAIMVNGEQDGRFDPGDLVLFYGQSPVTWTYNTFYQKYEHEVNLYTDHTCYFLTVGSGPGLRISTAGWPSGEPTDVAEHRDIYMFHEEDNINLIKSGKMWYGEVFSDQVSYDFNFELPHLDFEYPVFFRANLVARSTEDSHFDISAEGVQILQEEVAAVVLNSSIYARSVSTNYVSFTAEDEKIGIRLTYSRPTNTSVGWLNYILINGVSKLVFDGGFMPFSSAVTEGPGRITRFNIQSTIPEVEVWDVTDPLRISRQSAESIPGGLTMLAATDSLRWFIIFDNTAYRAPEIVGEVPNQDLHGMSPAEYVIVAYPDFNAEAQRLADFHRQSSRLSTIIVSPAEIYNEFSSGVEDVTAIRDFTRMLYNRSGDAKLPRYLLLFGDASYDYKDRIPDDHNLVPAFQSRESLRYASSFVTDDYFGCMDPDEGSNGAGTPDIGVGRFPVRDIEQARHMVDKVIHYATGSGLVSGPWRNSVCYIADDEDNNIHLNQAEQLSGAVDTIAPCFNLAKIYLDAYGQVKSPAGDRYPDVNAAIDKAVTSGALIVNYTGHGGETGLAHERVLDVPMIQSWDNIDRLTAFVTATCEFSRYDDPSLVSAGEMVLLNQKGGGIGLFTTSRLAYSQSNFAMNKRFYQAAFEIDSVTGEYPRLGDLLRLSKTPSNQNIKNFVLLGDPALMLAYPQYRIKAVEILREPEGLPADTLTALSRITVKAQVQDLGGVKIGGFNGKAYPMVYDKPVNYNTRANDPGSRIQDFRIANKVLFKGEATITSGEFHFTFIVPRDIMYSYGDGKISYYAVDTVSWIDAQGHDTILIGGSDGEPIQDTTGPEISVFLNHYSFESGDATTPDPMLIVGLRDESGINTVGNGIGHDLIAILDSNYVNPILLNDKFIPATDDFRTGEVRTRLSTLDNGLHTLTVRAWDVLNNSSEETIYFHVNTEDHVFVNGLYNYPNPLKEGTSFVFRHNKPGQDVNVVIRIYSMSGALIQTLQYTFNTEYLESGPLYWNGRDSGGNLVPGGLYVYQTLVTSNTGLASSLSQKMLIVR